MSKVLDMLLGGEDPVSVMQPGPVRTVRRGDGLLNAVAEPLSYAPGPLGVVAEAARAYGEGGATGLAEAGANATLSLFGGKAAPALKRIVTRAERVPNAKQTWRGVDNIERANIDDRKAVALKSVDTIPDASYRRLGDILAHDELFKLYPEAAKIPVRPMPKGMLAQQGQTTRAAYDKENNVIYVRKGLTKEQQESSILHELGHFVQREEGLLPGTSTVRTMPIAQQMKDELTYLQSTNPKLAEVYVRNAWKKHGINLEQPTENIAMQMYLKQQGEADSIGAQKVFEKQQRQRQVLSRGEMAAMPQPPLEYVAGKPINQDTIFEDIFGYAALEPEVPDMTKNGTPGFRGRINEKKLLGL